MVAEIQQRVHVIAGGKLFEAIAADRREYLPIQVRDHVKMFHYYFYSLEPDDQVIKRNITRALYLADISVKSEYDNLTESGYYSGMISGNISQQIEMDSIRVNIDKEPYYVRYYGKLKLIRATSIVTRSLKTEGYIRITKASDNNVHGFLLERWHILENEDLTVEKR